MTSILRRLDHIEEKLDTALRLGNRSEIHEAQTVKDPVIANSPITTPSARTTNAQVYQATEYAGLDLLSKCADKASSNYKSPTTFPNKAAEKLRYLEKTPLICEEERLPLPDFIKNTEPTKSSDIMPFVGYFLDYPCAMYPITCNPSAHEISGLVVAQGFREDLPSCFTLLIVALAKAYKNEGSIESGFSDFQRATHLLGRLGIQFSIQHVQLHILSAIFLLKKGRLLDFWNSLHAACSTLYTTIRR